ncbi:positive regulation of interleukin-4-mediated signaling pathway [Desmophyllum pertusum]|uniref:Positive regulation of interleukin-4-mediated signaling pathway n=1 Tax=Desmophyllum pertusum TaxID=174260 RepID=A0A9X0CI37_9CNID|nr:positive regulation of interleukin-4-mediated signaling pathway [Desmophyllum pertusum]
MGTGNLGFPYATAVQIMIEAAVDYSQANPESPLEEFRFVVFSGDQKGITTFEEKFGEFKKDHKPGPKPRQRAARKPTTSTPVAPEFQCKEIHVGEVVLKVLKGDITKESSDAICNVVTQDLDMNNGTLSRAIFKACGSTVEEELKSKGSQRPGSVVTTCAGSLSAKHIVHMVVGSGTKQHLQTCVEKAIKQADSLGLRSVSIPAVGSGGLGRTAEDSAEVVFGAIRAATARPFNSIREVTVVVFEASVIGAFVVELEAIQKETGDSYPDCDEEDEDQVGGEGALEASTDELTKKRCRQKVIVHGRLESFDAAMVALKDGVARACSDPRVIKHEIISRLPKRCTWELKRMSRVRDVKLDQPEPDTIRLEGLPKDVMDINSEVSNVIQEQLEVKHKEDRAEQMSKNVQWYLVNPAGKLDPFEKMANNEIESAFKEKKPSLLFTHQNLKAEINFGNKEVTFLRTGAIKRVLRKDGKFYSQPIR